MFKTRRSRIGGWAILIAIIVVIALNFLNFAITRSSTSVPADSNSLRTAVKGFYRGDLGFWLTGDPVKSPVTDWSFADSVPTIQIETRTWYLLPHFVRTYIARNGQQLFLFSEYFAPKPGQPDHRDEFPNARFWNRMVVRDPHIRVKIGNRLLQMRAYPLKDPDQIAVAREAFSSKYADVKQGQELPESLRARLYFFRLEPGWNDKP